MESYVERSPWPSLAGVIRTVWVQRTGDTTYLQRHLPTGGVEIHFPIGGAPQLIGTLTAPLLELVPARTVMVGVRFLPGAPPPLPVVLNDLVDQRIGLGDLWGSLADRLAEAMACAATPERALEILQAHLLQDYRRAGQHQHLDPLVREATDVLMPWHRVEIAAVADRLALSESQLRRRVLHAVGLSPKALQRTLRFQGFLALAQAGATASGRRGSDGVAGLAVDVGYADQAHLNRECLRLTGVTPRQLLRGSVDRCACGHDHAASYKPFLARRRHLTRRP